MESDSVIRIGVAPWIAMNPNCFVKSQKHCKPGVELEILDTLIRSLNKSIIRELVPVEDRGCGSFRNDQWGGLSELLITNKIDIIGNLCDLDLERLDNFGYSFPVWQYPQAYLMKAPEPEYHFNPLAPFQSFVWLAIFVAFIIWYGIVVARTVIMYRKNIVKSLAQCAQEMLTYSLGFTDPTEGKFCWFLWISFFGYLTIIYDAYIKNALLYSKAVPRPFDDSRGFADSMLSGTYLLLDTRDPAKRPPCVDNDTCITFQKAIDVGKYVFVDSPTDPKPLVQALANNEKLVLPKGKIFLESYLHNSHNNDNFWLFEDEAMSGKWSVFLWTKNFTYKNHFNKMIKMMGDFKFLVHTRYIETHGPKPNTGQYIESKVMDNDAIQMRRFKGPFALLFAGMLLAIVIFLSELILFKVKKGCNKY